MRVRSLRWLVVFGIAAIAFGAIGYSVAEAQPAKIPDAEVSPVAEQTKPPGWDGSGEHPGKADFEQYCRLCHTLSETTTIGPGLFGISDRVAKGPAHEGKSVDQRLLEFLKNVDPAAPEKTTDPYFKEVQETVAGPGIQMTLRGGLPESADDRRILNIIDYILRFRDVEFDEKEYLRDVKSGRSLVAGDTPFAWGGPACSGCHSVGADPDMLGANIGPNIGHTYVLMRERGKDDKNNYTDGLKDILSGENAPKAHRYYKDVEGSSPLTEAELKLVATFFEQAARDTGTEQNSNYLPILALLFAALCIVALEPGIVNILFAKEHGEYIDGPYMEDDHHGHDDHHEEPKPSEEVKVEEKAEEKAAQEPNAEEPKPDEAEEEPKAEDKPADESKAEDPGDKVVEETKPESRDTEYSPKPAVSDEASTEPEETKAEDVPKTDEGDKPEDKSDDKKEDS